MICSCGSHSARAYEYERPLAFVSKIQGPETKYAIAAAEQGGPDWVFFRFTMIMCDPCKARFDRYDIAKQCLSPVMHARMT